MSLLDDVINRIDNEVAAEAFDEDNNPNVKGYHIKTEQEADGILLALNKKMTAIAEAEMTAADLRKHYNEKVDAWLENSTKKIRNDCEWYKSLLNDYAAELFGEKGGKKPLMNGVIQYKKQSDEIKWDEEAAMRFMHSNNVPADFITVKTTESLNKSEIKKRSVKKDGGYYYNDVRIDGLELVPRPMQLVLPNGIKYVKPVKVDEDIDIPF